MSLPLTLQQSTAISTVLDAVANGGGKNFCLRARAGTGKTFLCIELIKAYVKKFPLHEVLMLAFGNKAAAQLKTKLTDAELTDWRQASASTIHAFGLSLLKFRFKPKVWKWKVRDLIALQNGDVYQQYAVDIATLVHFAKLEGFGFFPDVQIGDVGAWYKLADHYDLNGFDDTSDLDDVVAAAQYIYQLSLDQTDVIDYDDMILFPLVKNIAVKFQKDMLILDEAQDTGRARQALIKKIVKPNGTFFIVGDDRQSIFQFAGAQSDALQQLIDDLNMQVLPLTVCWRCPKAVIRDAQRQVPDIEWAPNAAEGAVLQQDAVTAFAALEPVDAILCRNTAPLIEVAYSLLRRGIACRVEGRELSSGLLRLVNRWKIDTIDEFLHRLDDYRVRETQKAVAKGHEDKVGEINDRCATLVHLCNVCLEKKQTTLDDLRAFIDSMFGDDVKESGMLTLATYHRAKGREFNSVYLFEHARRCPSPYARKEWQRKSEDNLEYVAQTRAMEKTVYVH